jgi:putative nucleotidyltransferase with HDIG domain
MYKPIIKLLRSHGFSAWICGGSARDLYLGLETNGHEIAVKATLNQLREELGDKVRGINEYDTSLRIHFMDRDYTLCPLKKINLVNTYYSFDYVTSLEEDASTRDFTINALYYDPLEDQWFDFNNGKKDADDKIIRFVGDPKTRILESKVRMMRAAVLSSTLGEGWNIDNDSQSAIKSYRLKAVPIHPKQQNDEFVTLLKRAEKPSKAFKIMRAVKLLDAVFPELKETIGIEQSNKADNLDLFSHIMLAVDSIPLDKPNSFIIRLAALLHDIGKPYTMVKTPSGIHFYNHENVGAYIAERILQRWGFNKQITDKILILIRNHLFDASSTKSEASIKKLISRIGVEHIHDLLDLRIADRLGTGRPDISMQKIYQLRDKINNQLAKTSPNNFKLQINQETLETLLGKFTDNTSAAISEARMFLESRVIYGRLSNKQPNLKKALSKIIRIRCPLDKAHLLKTWADIQSGSAETFPNGKLVCGVYCNFLCNQYMKNQ